MAQYDFTSAPLIEAGEEFCSIADGLGAISEQLSGVLSNLPEKMLDLRRRTSAERDAVDSLSLFADRMGRTLLEIIEVYTRAERSYFGESDSTNKVKQETAQPPVFSPPIVHKSHRVLFSDALVVPDWLQVAILRYEQSV